MLEELKELEGKAISYSFALDNLDYWNVYNCKKYDYRFNGGIRIYIKLDNYVEMADWCVEFCEGRFTDWSEWMGEPVPGTEEGFCFELEGDAAFFHLTFCGKTDADIFDP